MGGEIKIASDKCWLASGWCYATITDEIAAVLRETQTCPGLLEYLTDPAESPQVVSGVDLTSRPRNEQRAFHEAAVLALERLKQDPDFSAKHLERCQILIDQLDGKLQ